MTVATVTVDLAIFTIRDGLEVFLEDGDSMPGRRLDLDESLEATARRALTEVTGLDHVYMEQLYTFGDPERVSVAYFAAPGSS